MLFKPPGKIRLYDVAEIVARTGGGNHSASFKAGAIRQRERAYSLAMGLSGSDASRRHREMTLQGQSGAGVGAEQQVFPKDGGRGSGQELVWAV